MDPVLAQLATQLAEITLRNTASAVTTRIRSVRARRKDADTIAELEDIVNDLLADRAELVRISHAYEQELTSQRISDEDIAYITDTVIPIIEKFVPEGNPADPPEAIRQQIDSLKTLISKETITLLQLIGFNFRAAIGEPLTQVARNLILNLSAISKDQTIGVQELQLRQQVALFEVAKDPDAFDRLRVITDG